MAKNQIVAQFTDVHGNKVALFAHKNFKWSVYTDINGFITTLQTDRVKAKKEYKRLRKIYHPKNKSEKVDDI